MRKWFVNYPQMNPWACLEMIMFSVQTAKHYPAIWEWEAFAGLGYHGHDCPEAAKICSQVLSLPVFPSTGYDDLEYIAWAVKQTIYDLKKN